MTSDGLFPLNPVQLQLLLVLAEGVPLHGYALMQKIDRQSNSQVQLDVGSLYRIIGRLLDSELIIEAPTPQLDDQRRGRRRRYYALTEQGRAAIQTELARLRHLLTTAAKIVPG